MAASVSALVLLGWFAGSGLTWAFVFGMLAYAADGVLLARGAQWAGVGVHVVVLIFLYGGLTAAGMAVENEQLARDLVIQNGEQSQCIVPREMPALGLCGKLDHLHAPLRRKGNDVVTAARRVLGYQKKMRCTSRHCQSGCVGTESEGSTALCREQKS